MSIQNTFDQPVLLRQSPKWSRFIAWGIIGITAFTIAWASIFEIDESIPAQGKLEPNGSVTDIQAPIGGVVKQIQVVDGQQVKKGDVLIIFEQTTSQSQLESLKKSRIALLQQKEATERETKFYRDQTQASQLNISSELAFLIKNRATIASENQLFRAQLNGTTTGANLTPEQKLRLQSRQLEYQSRASVAQLEIAQTQEQLRQVQAQLKSALTTLAINKDVLSRYELVAKQGAISKIQVLKQQQDVETKLAEINRLTTEKERLKLVIFQAKEKLSNTVATDKEELFAKITANEKSIADIDSQLSKIIIENQKRVYDINSQISQIDSEISKAKETLKYQRIISPIEGTVFELKPKTPNFVVNVSEPILKIVPNDNLIAKVHVTNRDIGFVKEQQTVDVRIDSFPFQKYGDIKGTLTWVGSDALPPDQVYPYYRFPVKVRLDKQSLIINNRKLPLQSGMSINANIKLRKRTVMSIFTDFIIKKTESLKFLR